MPVFHNRLKTHYRRCFPVTFSTHVVPAHWQCHFGHNLDFIVLYQSLSSKHGKSKMCAVCPLWEGPHIMGTAPGSALMRPWPYLSASVAWYHKGVSALELLQHSVLKGSGHFPLDNSPLLFRNVGQFPPGQFIFYKKIRKTQLNKGKQIFWIK